MMVLTPNDARNFREFERCGFNAAAAGYRRFFADVTRYAIEPLLAAAAVRPCGLVLDLATGPGDAAFHASRLGASVIAIDIAEQMLHIAAIRYPGIDMCAADAERLPLADNAVDAVVCNFGIGHFPDAARALTEVMRVLVPLGTVALSWWDRPERHRLNGIFFDAVENAGASVPQRLPPGPPVFRFSEDDELVALCREVGLQDVSVETHSAIHVVPSAEELWNGILQGTVRTAAAIKSQPEAVRSRIRSSFEQLLLPYFVGGSLRIPVAFKIVSGKKPSA